MPSGLQIDPNQQGWETELADIGEALVDADLFQVYNDSGGSLVTSALSRIKTYIQALVDDSSGWKVITDTILSGGDAPNFDFTSIPQIYKHLKLILSLRSDYGSAGSDAVYARFNNDSGANYDYIVPVLYTSYSYAEGIEQAQMWATTVPAGLAVASDFGGSEISIPDYTNANINKTIFVVGTSRQAATTTNIRLYNSHCHWRSTAAISRITIFPSLGSNWKQYSRATLLGLL